MHLSVMDNIHHFDMSNCNFKVATAVINTNGRDISDPSIDEVARKLQRASGTISVLHGAHDNRARGCSITTAEVIVERGDGKMRAINGTTQPLASSPSLTMQDRNGIHTIPQAHGTSVPPTFTSSASHSQRVTSSNGANQQFTAQNWVNSINNPYGNAQPSQGQAPYGHSPMTPAAPQPQNGSYSQYTLSASPQSHYYNAYGDYSSRYPSQNRRY